MPYDYPPDQTSLADITADIELEKKRRGFEEAVVRYMWPRALKLTGMLSETWGDRGPYVAAAIRQEFNPQLCHVICDPDPRAYHDLRQDNDDSHSLISVHGHDGIRGEIDAILREIYPRLDSYTREDIRRGCEEVLFYFVKDTFALKRR